MDIDYVQQIMVCRTSETSVSNWVDTLSTADNRIEQLAEKYGNHHRLV